MDIELVNLVIGVAVLLVTIEFSSYELNRRMNKYIKNWETSINLALSALAKANKLYRTISDEVAKTKAGKIEEQRQYVDDIRKKVRMYREMEWVGYIKLFLPFLLIIEVGHIALQYFRWSGWYDQIRPGLNNFFLLSIIVLMLLFSIFMIMYANIVNSLSKKKFGGKTISEFEADNSEIIVKYGFGML